MYYPQQPVTTTMTAITVEKAISAIKTAAEEIPADEFISYSTILDVHLSYALEVFSRKEQLTLLEAVEEVLNENEELTKNIAWDLIVVLLPFFDSPPQLTEAAPTASTAGPSLALSTDPLSEIASRCLRLAVAKGNPREVFLKILSALSSLSFAPPSTSGPYSDAGDEDADDLPPPTPETPQKDPSEARVNGFRKFNLLLDLFDTINTRISTTFPSRFLSQSLTTVLRTFTTSIESLNRTEIDAVVTRILQSIDSLQPVHTKRSRVGSEPKLGPSGRPVLPPRTSTLSIQDGLANLSTEDDAKEENEEEKRQRLEKEERARLEEQLQIRLLQSFLTHLVEVYILRCPTEEPSSQSERYRNSDSALKVGGGKEGSLLSLLPKRGIQFHFASRYLKNKNLGGGVIEAEIAETSSTTTILKQIMDMSFQLGISSNELLELCAAKGGLPDIDTSGDELKSPSTIGPTPKFVEDIPLSTTGSLLILAANVYNKDAPELTDICLFPEHKEITGRFLRKENAEADIAVIDAGLFLGIWIMAEGGGIGDTGPDATQLTLYLRTYALLSALSPSPLIRLLAHTHLSNTIHAVPDEEERLEYIKDTLEHCPFEQLKAAVVGILKNEIDKATASVNTPTSSTMSPIINAPAPNIFATSAVLEELSMFLFPDLSTGVLEYEGGFEWFEENYGTIMATANLWLFLLIRSNANVSTSASLGGEKEGICGIREYDGRIESRWAGELRSWVESVNVDELKRRKLETQVEMVRQVLETIKAEQEKIM